MPPRLHLRNLPRYKDLALLLWRHGGTDLLEQTGLAAALDVEPSAETKADARDLARDLEQLGPAYVKLGQLLSSRADLLPPAYLEALSRLQNRVEPFPFAEVETTIEGELGVRPSKAFAELEARPLAAASLGQVHRARLRDGRLWVWSPIRIDDALAERYRAAYARHFGLWEEAAKRAAVGLARVSKAAYPDPGANGRLLVCVDVRADKPLPAPVPLEALSMRNHVRYIFKVAGKARVSRGAWTR